MPSPRERKSTRRGTRWSNSVIFGVVAQRVPADLPHTKKLQVTETKQLSRHTRLLIREALLYGTVQACLLLSSQRSTQARAEVIESLYSRVIQMGLFDVHAHLTHPKLRQNIDSVLERAREAGLTRVISNGLNLPDN